MQTMQEGKMMDMLRSVFVETNGAVYVALDNVASVDCSYSHPAITDKGGHIWRCAGESFTESLRVLNIPHDGIAFWQGFDND